MAEQTGVEGVLEELELPTTPEVTSPAGAPQLYSPEIVSAVLEMADLTLTAEWQALLLSTLNDLQPAVHRLRQLDLGETPPATAFDPRWS